MAQHQSQNLLTGLHGKEMQILIKKQNQKKKNEGGGE